MTTFTRCTAAGCRSHAGGTGRVRLRSTTRCTAAGCRSHAGGTGRVRLRSTTRCTAAGCRSHAGGTGRVRLRSTTRCTAAGCRSHAGGTGRVRLRSTTRCTATKCRSHAGLSGEGTSEPQQKNEGHALCSVRDLRIQGCPDAPYTSTTIDACHECKWSFRAKKQGTEGHFPTSTAARLPRLRQDVAGALHASLHGTSGMPPQVSQRPPCRTNWQRQRGQ